MCLLIPQLAQTSCEDLRVSTGTVSKRYRAQLSLARPRNQISAEGTCADKTMCASWQLWWSPLLLSYLVFLWLSLKSKRLFKSHYDLKGGWLLAFTFPPQATLFNISIVVVQENSTIFICYTFLPSAGKTIK